jgi:hypothetical protein
MLPVGAQNLSHRDTGLSLIVDCGVRVFSISSGPDRRQLHHDLK